MQGKSYRRGHFPEILRRNRRVVRLDLFPAQFLNLLPVSWNSPLIAENAGRFRSPQALLGK
jgi:hypothetical protein